MRWSLLAVLVGIVMSLQALRPVAPPGEATNATLRFQARYAVGLARMREKTGAPLSDGQRHDLLRECDGAARNARDRLRLVAVAGELGGATMAREQLDAVAGAKGEELDPELARDFAIVQRIYDGDEVDEADVNRLVQRHGWFGKLATTWALPPDDPAHRAPRVAAVRAAAGLGTLVLLGIGAVVAGFVLLVVAGVRRFGGRLPFAYRPPAASPRDAVWFDAVLAFFILMLVLSLVGLGEPVLLVVLPGVALLPRLFGYSWAEWRDATGWHRGAGVLREIGRGLLGYICGLPVLLGGFLVTAWLSALAGTRLSHPIVEEAEHAPFAWAILTAVVWAPIVEETLFRGIFFRYLRARTSMLAAALVTGFVFAAVHPQGWTAIPALMAIGAWLAVLREWRGSIIASMTAHALHNGILVTALYLSF